MIMNFKNIIKDYMKDEYARQIINWKYEDEYAVYNLPSYEECIDKVIYSEIRTNNRPYGIMMNIYGDKFCVFEVWNIERSLPKDIELDR